MNINPAIFTVAQLREQVAALDPTRPTSKLRKAELITLLGRLQREELGAQDRIFETEETVNAERQDAETVDQVINEELGDVAPTTLELAHAITPEMRTSAKALAAVAWGHLRAAVRSMGREVHGKVVDTVLRGAGPDGMGRVCVVVQHTEQANTDWLGNVTWGPTPTYRRTLHRYVDVKFSPLAS